MKRRKSNGELLDDFEALNSDSDSDCSNTEHENCSICLLRLGRQNIGTPSTCRHRFCLECILEWSCSNNTCPVDRQIFNIINVYNKHKEKVKLYYIIITFNSLDVKCILKEQLFVHQTYSLKLHFYRRTIKFEWRRYSWKVARLVAPTVLNPTNTRHLVNCQQGALVRI